MSNWQKVFSDEHQHRSEIVTAVLKDFGVRPVMVNKRDAAYQLGCFDVLVASAEVIRAIKIIEDDIKFE